jgi:hypothetical protein
VPIGSDPEDSTHVVLKVDEKAEPKPTFRARFLTDREMRKANRILREARQALQDDREDEAEAKQDELFALCLAGWDNVTYRGNAMVFGTHKPGVDFLTTSEVWELATQCILAPQITEKDRKNFASPSEHDGAAPASAPAANAPTPQAPTPPSA